MHFLEGNPAVTFANDAWSTLSHRRSTTQGLSVSITQARTFDTGSIPSTSLTLDSTQYWLSGLIGFRKDSGFSVDQTDSSTSFEFRTSGIPGSNISRDFRVTGILLSNTPRDFRVTGTATASHTRDFRETGTATSNTARDFKVQSQLTINTTRDFKVQGQLPSSDTRDFRVTGKITVSQANDFRVRGQATSSGTQDFKTQGQATSFGTQDFKLVGMIPSSDTRDFRVRGQATSFGTQDFKIQGQASSNTTADLRVTGQATSLKTQDFRVNGQLTTSNASDFRVTGTIVGVSDARDFRVFGRAAVTPTSVVSLDPMGEPDTRTYHALKVRARVQSGSGTLYLALYEGAINRSIQATGPSATFGYSGAIPPPYPAVISGSYVQATKYTMPETGLVTQLSIALDGFGAGIGPQYMRAVIYADDGTGTQPGSLIARSAEFNVADNSAYA